MHPRTRLALTLALLAALQPPAGAEDYFVRRNVGGIRPGNPPPEWVTAANLGQFLPGAPVSITLEATDSPGQTVSYALGQASTLPGGLALDGNQLTGAAPPRGDYSFAIVASDNLGAAAAQEFTLSTNGGPVWQATTSFAGNEGAAFSQTLSVSDDDGLPPTVTVNGAVPPGFAFSTGTLQWSAASLPAAGGTLSLRATDSQGEFTDQDFTVTVNGAPVFSGGSDLGAFAAGGAVSATITATDPDGIAGYSIIGSANGLAVNAAGQVTGTAPGGGGSFNVTFRATDTGGAFTDRTYSFFSNSPPVWQTATSLGIEPVIALSLPISATDSADGDTITYSVVGSPTGGLGLTGSAITGTPTGVGGPFSITVAANDGRGASNSVVNRTFSLITAGTSCKQIRDIGTPSGSGSYGIFPGGAKIGDGTGQQTLVYCEMTTDGGGWTRVARVTYGTDLWNGWTTDSNIPGADETAVFGLAFNRFSGNSTGSDLHVMIKVNGSVFGQIWTGANLSKWFNPTYVGNDGAQTLQKRPAGGSFANCTGVFGHGNDGWNWSIGYEQSSPGVSDPGGCGGWDGSGQSGLGNGGSFILHGNSATPGNPDTDRAQGLYGGGLYSHNTSWTQTEIFVRNGN